MEMGNGKCAQTFFGARAAESHARKRCLLDFPQSMCTTHTQLPIPAVSWGNEVVFESIQLPCAVRSNYPIWPMKSAS